VARALKIAEARSAVIAKDTTPSLALSESNRQVTLIVCLCMVRTGGERWSRRRSFDGIWKHAVIDLFIR
jgi:hypothetical protein